ncbi:MAG: D-aminoacyl-tRNA deacylase [Bacteroidales bacterium]|nr:D-aminoacyl-tRNA deacylase [Bacteroidales bacterium]
MRALIQRVAKASVWVDGKEVGKISRGLLVFLGIEQSDTSDDIPWLANKIVGLRIFADSDGKMNLSVRDVDGEILLISQFTLHAMTKKGYRPSFARAMEPVLAEKLFHLFINEMKRICPGKIHTGVFGAYMQVELVNDGPVTIMIDTQNKDL